jgi:HK97 family phage prohead protease
MKKDYLRNIDPKAERRYLVSPVSIKKRDDAPDETGRTIIGYASVYNSIYPICPGYAETVLPGAFDDCDMSDVVALYNHDDEFLLARCTNGKGTLKLSLDDHGLKFEFEAPNTTAGNDILENIRLGNIQGCSFAFTIAEEKIDYEVAQADGSTATFTSIVKVGKLYDVGPVVFPAYEDTEVETYCRNANAKKVPQKDFNANTYMMNLRFTHKTKNQK